MPYSAGTLTAAVSSVIDFQTVTVHDALVAAGFVYVEEVTFNNYTMRVYCSPAASNATGVDWFLYTGRLDNTTSGLYLLVSETWDATGKLIKDFAPNSASATPASNGKYVHAGLGVNAFFTAHNVVLTLPSAGSGFQWWISATPNRVIIAIRSGVNDYGAYMGLAEDAVPSSVAGTGPAAGYVLTTLRLSSYVSSPGTPNSTGGSCTREPGQPVSSNSNWSVIFNPFLANNSTGPSAYDGIYRLSSYLARPMATSSRSTIVPRFLLPADVLYSGSTVLNSFVNGDTLTVGAKTYVRMGANIYVDNSL